MRLPFFRSWAGIPELDGLREDDKRLVVAVAKQRHAASEIVVAFPTAFVGLGLAIGAGFLLFLPIDALRARGILRAGTAAMLGLGVLVVLLIGVLALAAAISDRWLRWAIRDVLRHVRCAACGYPLAGLPIAQGHVTCPECGARHPMTTIAESARAAESG